MPRPSALGLIRSIDENTPVPIKVVVLVALSVWWLAGQFAGVNSRIDRIEAKFELYMQSHPAAQTATPKEARYADRHP